jgi:dipeptidyl-peptidase-4
VGEYHILSHPSDSLYSKVLTIPYPKVSTTNPSARIGVVSISSFPPPSSLSPSDESPSVPPTLWLDIPGHPRENYIAMIDWADNSDNLILQQLNREQNQNTVWMADRRDGSVTKIYCDCDEAWVDFVSTIFWISSEDISELPEDVRVSSQLWDEKARGRYFFTFLSEEDGWRHVYLISRDGKHRINLTPGDYDVVQFYGIDTSSHLIYFLASPSDPTQRLLYSLPLSLSPSPSSPTRLSPLNGCSSYSISRDFLYAHHTHSTLSTPPFHSIVTLPKHDLIRILESNAKISSKFSKVTSDGNVVRRIIRLRVPSSPLSPSLLSPPSSPHSPSAEKIDITPVELEMDGWIVMPPNFDSTKKYPLIVYVYGEPAAQTVLDQWDSYTLYHTHLALLGYVVVSVDGRGTPAPKGRVWRKSIYGKVGIVSSEDQANAVKSLLREYPFLDKDRIGVWGWSGGGSMSLNAIFRYPELYRSAIAIAFVANQQFYDTIYQVPSLPSLSVFF